jgi:hypothetical protein
MADPAGEADGGALRLDFDRRVMLRFHGSAITSDGGLLAYRELDDVLALTTSGGERLAEARTGRNRRHLLVGLLRQSVFGRLAGYEDVNDVSGTRGTATRAHECMLRQAPAGGPGWQVIEAYADEISGTKGRERRPAFDRMLKAAVRRKFDMIAAWSVDRLGRSLQDLVALLGEPFLNTSS